MDNLLWLDTDATVHGSADSLLAAEIAFGRLLHRCNQLEIAKGGSHVRTPEPRKSTTD